MIISEEQKQKLKRLLTESEYAEISKYFDDIGKFQDFLNDYIVMRFKNDEPTPEADKLEGLYFEIYNQN